MKSFFSAPLWLSMIFTVHSLTVDKRDDRNRAVYFLDMEPSGNSIVALKINVDDGTLSSPVRTSTGGTGIVGNGATGPNQSDGLFSQDSVVVNGDYLFTVNSLSNTVSMFVIDGNDPTHPKLVGTPQSTLGQFPMSVAYSSHIKTACVLNGGAVGGVACFSADHAKGLKPLDSALRPVSLQQSTPPVGPPGTASDIFFNPSGTALFATIKGNPGPPAVPGFLFAWPVKNGLVSSTPVVNQRPDLIIDFSASFLGSDSRLLMTDPAYGAVILSMSPALEVSTLHHIPIAGEKAICWSVFSSRFNSVYVMDVGTTVVTVIDPNTGAIKGQAPFDAITKGGNDGIVDRRWLYILGGDQSIVVMSLEGANSGKLPTQVQKFNLSSLGSRQGWMGMASYPNTT